MDDTVRTRVIIPDPIRSGSMQSIAIQLRRAACCGTCRHWRGWLDNMWCELHQIEIQPYLICDQYQTHDRDDPTEVR
jgi:hypothetical protein